MSTATTKKEILSVTIKHTADGDADFSFIGKFTDDKEDWNIVHSGGYAGKFVADLPEDAELPERGCREYRFFKPCAGGEKPGTAAYRDYALQDYKRMCEYNADYWGFIGISAEAKVKLTGSVVQEIHSGGLWGIESDSGDEYFKEVEADQLSELRQELQAIGFDDSEIDEAFENATHKED